MRDNLKSQISLNTPSDEQQQVADYVTPLFIEQKLKPKGTHESTGRSTTFSINKS